MDEEIQKTTESMDVPEGQTQIDLDDVEVVESKSSFDAKAFEGKKVKIEKVEIARVPDNFATGSYVKETEEMKWVTKVTTEPLKELDEKGNFTDKLMEYEDQETNKKKNITVTQQFNMGESEEGKPTVIKHEKASLWKAMKKLGVTKLSELKGKEVMLDTKPSTDENDDRVFLKLALN